jgi:hypothetical protein
MGKDSRSRSYERSKEARKSKERGKSRDPPSSSSDGDRRKERGSSSRQRGSSPTASAMLTKMDACSAQLDSATKLLFKTSTDLKESFAGRMDACEATLAAHSNSLSNHEQQLVDALKRLTILEGNADQIRQDAEQLSTRVARAEVQPPKAVPNAAFDRDPDPTKIKVNGPESFAKEELAAVVSSLLEQDGKSPDTASIVGSNVSRKFSVQFAGAGQIASGCAQRFLQFLKNGDGTYKQIDVKVPGPGNKSQQIYFGPDSSLRQERIEMLTRKLAKIIKTKVDDPKTVFARKRDGVVTLDFVPLASILVPSPNEHSLRWNTELLQTSGLNKEDIIQQFKAGNKSADGVKWSSSS